MLERILFETVESACITGSKRLIEMDACLIIKMEAACLIGVSDPSLYAFPQLLLTNPWRPFYLELSVSSRPCHQVSPFPSVSRHWSYFIRIQYPRIDSSQHRGNHVAYVFAGLMLSNLMPRAALNRGSHKFSKLGRHKSVRPIFQLREPMTCRDFSSLTL